MPTPPQLFHRAWSESNLIFQLPVTLTPVVLMQLAAWRNTMPRMTTLLRDCTLSVWRRTAASMMELYTLVPDGGFMYMTLFPSSTINVPGRSSPVDITSVSGTPLTNSSSVRRAMGAIGLGHPEGTAHVPRFWFHVWA